MSAYNQSRTDPPRTGVSAGSSTSAAGSRLDTADQRARYDPERSGYNSATGSGYQKPAAGGYVGQDERIEHAPSTVQRGKEEDHGAESRAGRRGEDVGRKTRAMMAGVHGAGESLRGGLNAAVDRAFGSDEGAAHNDEVAREGEKEIQSGEFAAKNAPQYQK